MSFTQLIDGLLQIHLPMFLFYIFYTLFLSNNRITKAYILYSLSLFKLEIKRLKVVWDYGMQITN